MSGSGLVDQSADGRSKTIGQNFRCRAWINFNGTGTIAIRGSGNISGISDLATGRYEVNLSKNMANVDYAIVATGNVNGSDVDTGRAARATHFYTSGVKLICGSTGGSAEDWEYVSVVFFR